MNAQLARFLARTRPGPRPPSWKIRAPAGAFLLVCAAALGLWIGTQEEPRQRLVALVWWGGHTTRAVTVVSFLLVLQLFAGLFAGEKDLGTMDALLSTPLPRRTIVHGRFRSAWRLFFRFLLALLPLALFLPRYVPTPRINPNPDGVRYLLLYAAPGALLFHPDGRRADLLEKLLDPATAFSFWTILAGAAAWLGLWIQLKALAWVVAAISLRAQDRVRALVWSAVAAAALLIATGAAFFGLLYLEWRVSHSCFCWLTLSVTAASLILLALLARWLRGITPDRFDCWALGREA